jgi:hypothetical protein
MTQEDKQEIIEILKDMKRGYNYMGGDYDFVKEITRWARGMSIEHREMLLQTLFELMIEGDVLGGYTLDVLVELGATEWAHRLEAMLPLAARDRIWYSDILVALMQLGYKKLLPLYLQYIESQIKKNDPQWIVDVALLYLVDRDESLARACTYLSRWLKSNRRAEDVSKYISVFVCTYCKINCDDLIELVRRTAGINREAGHRLSNLLKQEIQRPYKYLPYNTMSLFPPRSSGLREPC